ncbi:ABC-F family ATP-binding cassette domain-containing protein [Rhodococcus sp. D2-41]|uniref:ABC-F family ATP-binding cassette domain-containing protein n=1 Tax=Speluncibacter jeojiensis TaxID=2710754 RepID=UPI00240FA919|nr:ABC-F family ATP-binding cassette domain-containing protein [Rhodococcus sp. D2-41]MDG3011779.1 ABC-F family ATP-binding cassette domain-containing protein [Rhodococcus sp. D2-41]
MSATLHARGLSAGHGARTLFADLDLVLAPGDVIGLVGVNGAGKSTLLRLLAGAREPGTGGAVTLSPPDAIVGHLAQEHERRVGETVLEHLGRQTGVAAAEREMDAAAESLASGGEGEGGAGEDRYTPALERWLHLGGADLTERVPQVLDEVGFTLDPATAMTALSGGQAARVALAVLLLSRYDVLLLDEPTNDLDLNGLALLEDFVAATAVPLMVVSHDREFLARTVTGVVELDLAQGRVNAYDGGYESYLAEREIARRHARERYEEYADTRSSLEERARTQRNWLEHGVRNARRKSTDNDKIAKRHRAESTEKQAAKARQTQRRIERLEVVEEPRKEWELRMQIAAAPRSGSVVATLNQAVVTRGGFTLGPLTLEVNWADRIVITGANGAGKSTLLRLLLGTLTPDSGSATLGSGVQVGEVDQARGLFLGNRPLAEAFGLQVPDWPDAEVRTLLAKFGLRGPHVMRPASSLSPGERTRAALALLQARGVNLLVLDEPTNHLDLPAIEQLEQALADFEGTLLLVSHDRRLLDAVHSTRRWEVGGGTVRE